MLLLVSRPSGGMLTVVALRTWPHPWLRGLGPLAVSVLDSYRDYEDDLHTFSTGMTLRRTYRRKGVRQT